MILLKFLNIFFPPIISDYSDIQMADLPMLNGTINNDEALIFWMYWIYSELLKYLHHAYNEVVSYQFIFKMSLLVQDIIWVFF